ncbi:LuxR C-terminal-related transcriptional regulator [Leucobacter luti]|uniref:LuxR C-terminal-related transcriptional regulator n=1 Tax=Leucobacter luti TaxID=340320 RepID=UPI003D00D4B4
MEYQLSVVDQWVGEGLDAQSARLNFSASRIGEITQALSGEGSAVLLVGEAGSSKLRLAREAVETFVREHAEEIVVVGLHRAHAEPRAEGERQPHDLVRDIERRADGRAVIVVAPSLNEYSAAETRELERVVRSGGARVIGTARRLSGAASYLASHPRVRTLAVPPLALDEAEPYVARVLGAESIDLRTMGRWFRATAGNAKSLSLLATALDRAGRLARDRGVVHERGDGRFVPPELEASLRETCSPEELRTLEFLANFEPVTEAALLAELDGGVVDSLRHRGLVVAATAEEGVTGLSVSAPLLREALRALTPTGRVVAMSQAVFERLVRELGARDGVADRRLIMRAVNAGLDAGARIPIAWLWDAFERSARLEDPAADLRIALAVVSHPDASAVQFARATILAVRAAWILGDARTLAGLAESQREALRRLSGEESSARNASGDPGERRALRLRIQLDLVEHLLCTASDLEGASRLLDEAEREHEAHEAQEAHEEHEEREAHEAAPPLGGAEAERESIRAARMLLLARSGQLRAADDACPPPGMLEAIPVEWERARARAVSSLLLAQQGRFSCALEVAESAGALAMLGGNPHSEHRELLLFCEFFASWASGAVESARATLRRNQEVSLGNDRSVCLVETAGTLLALSDGSWRLAAQRAERLLTGLATFDRFGLSGFAQAAHALALAALGEVELSRRAMTRSLAKGFGFSRVLGGSLRLLLLRARLWNAAADTGTAALALAEWSQRQGLPAIELQALHIAVTVGGSDARQLGSRVSALSRAINSPLSDALAQHSEELFAGAGGADTPGARNLAELGRWQPLPPTDVLTPREREIAMLAALGYSSKWIAARFFLSVRTVDTHLRHIFTKLGVAGRDGLRDWFRAGHSARNGGSEPRSQGP